jgi:hypothetical protein
MMAVLGIMGQELLGVDGKWYEAGAKEYDIPNQPLLAVEFVIMGFLETKRFEGFKNSGTVSIQYLLAVRPSVCVPDFVVHAVWPDQLLPL